MREKIGTRLDFYQRRVPDLIRCGSIPNLRCLSRAVNREATRVATLDERMKKWLRKECCSVNTESRSHRYKNRLVRSLDIVSLGSAQMLIHNGVEKMCNLPVSVFIGMSPKGLNKVSMQNL